MINSVSNFFPATISRALPSVQRGADALTQTQQVTSSASVIAPGEAARSSFADKLPLFFSLSPADFSAIFSDAGGSGLLSGLFPQAVSAAYTQSTLLTANRLSINV